MSLLKSKKNILLVIFVLIAMLFFVFIPFSTADLRMKVYFEDQPEGTYQLYYCTHLNPAFSEEQIVTGEICEGYVEFVLPKEIHKSLVGLRLDFPEYIEPVIVRRFDFCSGGFVVKSISGTRIFSGPYIEDSNQITAASQIVDTYYIVTDSKDPFYVFSDDFCRLCEKSFSHYTVTKLLLCIIICAFILFPYKDIFSPVGEV